METLIKIQCDASAVALAATELKEYLGRLKVSATFSKVIIILDVQPFSNCENDTYSVNVDFSKGGGTIIGNNPRSVLFGCYKLLTMIGVRWIRPGKEGEYIPENPDLSQPFCILSQAAYRHRGLCIEGAMSKDNVLDTIQWMMRLGFNSYFIQFRNAYTFFARWYNHEENPEIAPEGFNEETAAILTREIQAEVKRRGMVLQMVGHGWTCEPLGIPGREWAPYRGHIPKGSETFFALVNGKRELWGGIPLNTNLCYGNELVREMVTDDVVKFAKNNPDVDIIHFWLADGMNNQCECPECIVKRPADWYVDLLNLVDKKLTETQSPIKIVFLIYVDLLWPPENSRLINPDRFIMMFAPITRSYSRPLIMESDNTHSPIPEFKRNHLEMPTDPGMNMVFLRAWQKICPVNDSFSFDYHFMWDHHKDPGLYAIVKTLHQDCRNLRNMGLDGFVSCQSSRLFFPHGLGMFVLGQTLWNPELTFDEMAADYFHTAYGEGWQYVQEYFRAVSALFQPPLWRNEGTKQQKKIAANHLCEYENLVGVIAPILCTRLKKNVSCQHESWALLEKHIDLCRLIVKFLQAEWGGQGNKTAAAAELFAWVRKNELRLQHVLDAYEFIYTYKHNFEGLSEL